jgi:hypothetical protein
MTFLSDEEVEACIASLRNIAANDGVTCPQENQTFQWPTDSPLGTQGQDYGHYNWGSQGNYHTGLDIIGTNVFAANNGTVEKIFDCGDCRYNGSPWSDNHVMQNVVILKHTDEGLKYSLYAHLGKIAADLTEGQSVTAGITPLGTTGVFCDRCTPPGRLNHVHFEIKDRAILHNPYYKGNTTPTDESGDICTQPPCYWGYVQDGPDGFGYYDPVTFLHNIINIDETSVTVNDNNVHVRMGPQIEYPVLTQVNINDRFIAFRKRNEGTTSCSLGWYQIKPSDSGRLIATSSHGEVLDGWICADYVE